MKRIIISVIILIACSGIGFYFFPGKGADKSSFIDDVTASEITAFAVCNCGGGRGSGDIGGLVISGGNPLPDGELNIADYITANRYFNDANPSKITWNDLTSAAQLSFDVAPLLKDEKGHLILQEGTNMVTQNCDGVVDEEDYHALYLASKLKAITFACQP